MYFFCTFIGENRLTYLLILVCHISNTFFNNQRQRRKSLKSVLNFASPLASIWFVGLVPLCHRRSKNCSGGYLVGPKYFLMGIGSVFFFSWVFRASSFFLEGILWVKIFPRSTILWFSINSSKKQKETYDCGILTKCFK